MGANVGAAVGAGVATLKLKLAALGSTLAIAAAMAFGRWNLDYSVVGISYGRVGDDKRQFGR